MRWESGHSSAGPRPHCLSWGRQTCRLIGSCNWGRMHFQPHLVAVGSIRSSKVVGPSSSLTDGQSLPSVPCHKASPPQHLLSSKHASQEGNRESASRTEVTFCSLIMEVISHHICCIQKQATRSSPHRKWRDHTRAWTPEGRHHGEPFATTIYNRKMSETGHIDDKVLNR